MTRTQLRWLLRCSHSYYNFGCFDFFFILWFCTCYVLSGGRSTCRRQDIFWGFLSCHESGFGGERWHLQQERQTVFRCRNVWGTLFCLSGGCGRCVWWIKARMNIWFRGTSNQSALVTWFPGTSKRGTSNQSENGAGYLFYSSCGVFWKISWPFILQ